MVGGLANMTGFMYMERPLKPIKLKTNNKENKENTESEKEEQAKILIHIDNVNIYIKD